MLLTGLLELKPDDASGELTVHIQGFFASNRVPPNDGVNIYHRLAANDTSTTARTGELGLLEAGVRGLERLEERDELRREAAQRGHLRREDRVAAGLR